jgi:hypothetical protein
MFESPQQKEFTEAWLKEYNEHFNTDLNTTSLSYMGLDAIADMKMDVLLVKGMKPHRQCPCLRCLKQRDREEGHTFQSALQSCPVCGNKRCPKATDHENACTHSNEPGQVGSSYA